jgi:MFS family permease
MLAKGGRQRRWACYAGEMAGQRFDPDYWAEIRTHWRALLSAMMGLGFGIGITAYTVGLYAPELIKSFGWSPAQLALLGTFGLLMLITQPITGWLADRFGVRPLAAVGIVLLPLCALGFSMMGGDIRHYFALNVLQILIGTLTTSPVYTRLVAERFVKARGLAFSIVMTGPPLFGGLFAPVLGSVIEGYGWQAGFQLQAIVTLIAGLIALSIMPRRMPQLAAEAAEVVQSGFGIVLKSPIFWVLIFGMILVNSPTAISSHQMALMLADSGAAASAVKWLIPLYAGGVIAGRFIFGVSLDRFPTHKVAAYSLLLPAIGLVVLASDFDSLWMFAFALALVGLAQGAEGDIGSFIAIKHFDLKSYSRIMGLVGASIAAGGALSSIGLRAVLQATGHFAPFLLATAALTVAGALLFLLLGREHAPPSC